MKSIYPTLIGVDWVRLQRIATLASELKLTTPTYNYKSIFTINLIHLLYS